jgi:signal peptidase
MVHDARPDDRPVPGRRRAPAPRAARVVRRTLGIALTCAIVGVAGALVVGYVKHYEALVVLSGSMGRTAPVGSLVVGRPLPAERVAVGDVILLRPPPGARATTPVLHRVIERTQQDGEIVVRTKGDANPAPDPEPHTLRAATVTPVLVVPGLGYFLSYMRTPTGWLMLILVSIAIVCLTSLRRRRPSTGQPSTGEPSTGQ